MFKIVKEIYHQAHVLAVLVHVTLVISELLHVLPTA